MPDLAQRVETVTNRFRRQLAQEDRAVAHNIIQRYQRLWQQTRRRLNEVVREVVRLQGQGQRLNRAQIAQLAAFQQLEAELRQRLALMSSETGQEIRQLQQVAVDLGSRYTTAVVREQDKDASLTPFLGAAVALGFLPNGQPVETLFDPLADKTVDKTLDILAMGALLGWTLRAIVGLIRDDGFGAGLSHTMRVARTEGQRPYRQVIQQIFVLNDETLAGWYWMSQADSHTCASCWAMHGTYHTFDEELDDHPNGRCVPMPAVRGVGLNVATGSQRFAALSTTQQLEILGPAKLEAYQAGKIQLSDLVHRQHNPIWGSVRREASLKQALG